MKTEKKILNSIGMDVKFWVKVIDEIHENWAATQYMYINSSLAHVVLPYYMDVHLWY